MTEYLIRRTDGKWFDLKHEQFGVTLRPTSFPSKPIEGWGDHRIKVLGCEVFFFYRDPGIHVSFEGTMPPDEVAKKIVDEIAANITKATGQGARVIGL